MTSPATGSPTPYGLKFTFQDPEGMSSGIVLQVYALADFANLPDGLPSAFETLQVLLNPAAGAFVPPPPTGQIASAARLDRPCAVSGRFPGDRLPEQPAVSVISRSIPTLSIPSPRSSIRSPA